MQRTKLPDLLRRAWQGWQQIVRSTWRAFMVFGSVAAIAILYEVSGHRYAVMSWIEVGYEVGVLMFLMFVASFVTALIFRYQVRRNNRWPGGGGRRRR